MFKQQSCKETYTEMDKTDTSSHNEINYLMESIQQTFRTTVMFITPDILNQFYLSLPTTVVSLEINYSAEYLDVTLRPPPPIDTNK